MGSKVERGLSMNYGYARVSTKGQQKNGNSLEDQVKKLQEAGCEKIFEEAYTGTKTDRPKFSELLSVLHEGDTLTVTKLDRFARNTADGVTTIQNLVSRGVVVNILNMGRADNTPMGKLMVTILLAFAEYERDMIVERTQTGKTVAREKGVRVDGRPNKYSEKQRKHAIELLQGGTSYNETAKITGISKSTLIREMRLVKSAGL